MTLRAVPEPCDTRANPFSELAGALGCAGTQQDQLWDAIEALSWIDRGDGTISAATHEAVNQALDVLISIPAVRAHRVASLRSMMSRWDAEGAEYPAAHFESQISDWESPA